VSDDAGKKGASMSEIIKFIGDEIAKAMAGGASLEASLANAEMAVRRAYAGERVYIAIHPKAQRAQQIARLELRSTREIAAASGIPIRTVRRLQSGR
jgi:hypothetical protein